MKVKGRREGNREIVSMTGGCGGMEKKWLEAKM